MITLDNISLEFGGRWLYRNATWQLKPGDRVGLIGRNGTGKTTLLKILTDNLSPTEGKVNKLKGLNIGYLHQELLSYESGKSVLGVALEAFEPVFKLKEEIDEILKKMETDQSEALITQLSEKQVELEARGGYTVETKTHEILAGLGFSEEDQHRPYKEMSGGWRMRVMLARLLLTEPDLLLLDEPTNHLDLPSIEWLESYLSNFRGAYVIVSHDRDILDRLVTSTVEIAHGRFHFYSGNYSYYLQEKVIRAEQHQREYENQQKFIADTERFINRFRAKATKAKQVQSKVKMLDKVERIEPPEAEAASMRVRFSPATTPGRMIVELNVKEKSYGEKKILKDSPAHILRGDKIALIGANGLGKSTLLRIVGEIEPFQGELRYGSKVEPAHFAQHQLEALTLSNSILEEMQKYSLAKGETYVRSILGCFLFSGEEVDKKIHVLSGGEKSRVALAKTLLTEANFLLLDEPTNHLDITSIEILINALNDYEGTFIVVSHDRYFLRHVANKIWYIEDKQLKEYPGNFEEFEYHLKNRDKPVKKEAPKVEEKKEADSKNDYWEQKQRKKEERRVRNELKRVEEKIMELEGKKDEFIAEMAKPENASNFDQLGGFQKSLNKVKKEIEALNPKWEELIEAVEQFEE